MFFLLFGMVVLRAFGLGGIQLQKVENPWLQLYGDWGHISSVQQ